MEVLVRALLILLLVACSGDSEPTDTPDPPTDTDTTDTDGDTDTGASDTDTTPRDSSDTGCLPIDVTSAGFTAFPTSPHGGTVDVHLDAPADAHVTCTLQAAPPLWRQLVGFGDRWKYLDDGSDPGPGWADPGFADAGWSEGLGPFAANDPGQTDLAGPPRVIWFRTTFEVDDPSAVAVARAAYIRDDGVAVYVNGTEAFRNNLPQGTLDTTTSALQTVSLLTEEAPKGGEIDPALLVAGTNTIAARVHQSGSSSDARFDLRLAVRVAEPLASEVHLLESEAPAADHELELVGMLADAAYDCVASAATCPGAPGSFSIATGPLVVPLPALAQPPEGGAPSEGAYTLFNTQKPCAASPGNRLMIVDPDGRPRWHFEIPELSGAGSIDLEAAWTDDGSILWGGGEELEGLPRVVHLDHTVSHLAAYPGADTHKWHHDVEWVGDEILGIVQSRVEDGADSWAGFTLLQYDPQTQQITWQWDAQDAYDAGQLGPPSPDDNDPYHANSLVYVEDDDGPGVYVSLYAAEVVIRIDKASGDITWLLGRGGHFALQDPSGAPLPADRWFTGMHALDMRGGVLSVYDNGTGTPSSHAKLFTLDTTARVATLEWDWTEYGWSEPVWGDADELENGNVLISMGHAWCLGARRSHLGALVEVERSTGDVVWRLDFLDEDDATYRGQRIDGCALGSNSRFCPEVADRL